MVMLLAGQPLGAWAKSQQPSFAARVHSLCAIAGKVAQLHSAGFVHRTLQPDCILWLQGPQQWVLASPSAMAPVGKEVSLAYVLQ
jgi:hypothetical protein